MLMKLCFDEERSDSSDNKDINTGDFRFNVSWYELKNWYMVLGLHKQCDQGSVNVVISLVSTLSVNLLSVWYTYTFMEILDLLLKIQLWT